MTEKILGVGLGPLHTRAYVPTYANMYAHMQTHHTFQKEIFLLEICLLNNEAREPWHRHSPLQIFPSVKTSFAFHGNLVPFLLMKRQGAHLDGDT